MRSRSRVASRAPTCCPSTTCAARSPRRWRRNRSSRSRTTRRASRAAQLDRRAPRGAEGARRVRQRLARGVRVRDRRAARARLDPARARRGADLDRSILILRRAGADVAGVPVDGDGIDTDALAAELERAPAAFLYVIPNFQNPSGATMSLERRKRVLELAAQHDVVVVEDDPYGLLRWAGESPPTLFELDGGERVMTLSSFTKTVAPGLRIGYVVAPEALAAAVGKHAENTYISPCMVSQAGLAAYCEAGYFEPGVERAKQALEERCDAMVESVQKHFPAGAQMVVPQGGYFLWVDLGPGADTTALAARAAEAGVPFVKGADFFADGGGTTCLRLAFSAVPPDRIREGIERLGAVIAGGLGRAGHPSHAARRPPARQPRSGRRTSSCAIPASSAPRGPAGAALPLDRLLGQPRAGERDHGHRPRRGLRPPQRRQRRRAHRPQLPLGAAVRGRGAAASSTSWSAGTTAAAACWRRSRAGATG